VALNEKQKAFAEYYAACFNATEAAKKAGYSKKTAYSIGNENLKKPEIQKYLQMLTNNAKSSRIATIDEVLTYLSDTMRNTDEQTKERTKAAQILREALSAVKAEASGNELRIVIDRQVRNLSLNKEQNGGDNI
jgi:phage terminase, small subunit